MNKFGLSLASGPTSEPVSLAQAKAHLRVDFTQDDDLITSLITVAREMVENILNRPPYCASISFAVPLWDDKMRSNELTLDRDQKRLSHHLTKAQTYAAT